MGPSKVSRGKESAARAAESPKANTQPTTPQRQTSTKKQRMKGPLPLSIAATPLLHTSFLCLLSPLSAWAPRKQTYTHVHTKHLCTDPSTQSLSRVLTRRPTPYPVARSPLCTGYAGIYIERGRRNERVCERSGGKGDRQTLVERTHPCRCGTTAPSAASRRGGSLFVGVCVQRTRDERETSLRRSSLHLLPTHPPVTHIHTHALPFTHR